MKITNEMTQITYTYFKKMYEGDISMNKTIDYLEEKQGLNRNSAADCIHNIKCMLNGKKYTRTNNAYATEYYLRNILSDYGEDKFSNALLAVKQHIDYYEELMGVRMHKLRAIHEKYSKELTDQVNNKYNWSKTELEAAIEAYVEIYKKEQTSIKSNKKKKYKELANKYGRSPKAYEYRMQNISSVLDDMGLPWISGLKPAKNVGANVKEAITTIIREKRFFLSTLILPASKPQELDKKVNEILIRGKIEKPKGVLKPKIINSTSKQYARAPVVKAWLLKESNGNCEACDSEAPFLKNGGQPFLEIHHIKRLKDGGSDTISNAVAICPNCHREFHYGANLEILKSNMIKKISRLEKE